MRLESTKTQNVFSSDVADISAIRPTSGMGPLSFSSNLDRLIRFQRISPSAVAEPSLLGGDPTIFVMGTREKIFMNRGLYMRTVQRKIIIKPFSAKYSWRFLLVYQKEKKPDGLFVCNDIRRWETDRVCTFQTRSCELFFSELLDGDVRRSDRRDTGCLPIASSGLFNQKTARLHTESRRKTHKTSLMRVR